MGYSDGDKTVTELRRQISALHEELRTALAEAPAQDVTDYVFRTSEGDVTLSELFGDKTELFVVHNMGKSCTYCTVWMDGFNGVAGHLTDRAAFVISSPDDPETQNEFAASRGWAFPIVSHQDNTFAEDMGYKHPEWGCMPGVSVFERSENGIRRVADTPFGPGDDFSGIWHLFDMLPGGKGDWEPKLAY